MKAVLRYYHVCGMVFVSCLIASNAMASKLIQIGPFLTSCSIVVFPISYIFGDVLTEVYGYRATGRIIWTGFACLILVNALFAVALAIPASPYGISQDAFRAVFGSETRIVIASLSAFLVGSFVSAFVMSRLKVRSSGRRLSLRFVLSTIAGEGLDSLIFYTLAFLGPLSPSGIVRSALSAALLKTLYEIVALPLTYRLIGWLKTADKSDVYDRGISYSPFHL
jgi:hypothetical protein